MDGLASSADGQRLIVNGNEQGHATRCYRAGYWRRKAQSRHSRRNCCAVRRRPTAASWSELDRIPTVAIYPIEDGRTAIRSRDWQQDSCRRNGRTTGPSSTDITRANFPARFTRLRSPRAKQTMVQELRPGAPAGVVTVSPVVVSRDGTRFAYSYNQTLSVLYLISGLQ